MLQMRVLEQKTFEHGFKIGYKGNWHKVNPSAKQVNGFIEREKNKFEEEDSDLEIQVKGNGNMPNINYPIMIVQ